MLNHMELLSQQRPHHHQSTYFVQTKVLLSDRKYGGDGFALHGRNNLLHSRVILQLRFIVSAE